MSEVQTQQRPTFLTVLCILSFIAAGISIIMLILGALAAGAASAMLAQAEAAGATVSGGTGSVWLAVGIAGILTIVSLVGVLQMWKLKKTGFYIYTGASVAGIIAGIVLTGFSPVSVIVSVAFIVMYGLNLKAMN
jgi:hypothetical protein